MSRLYYEPKVTARLTGDDPQPDNLKNYLEKIAKLIPTEIVAAYLTLIGFIKIDTSTENHQYYYVAAALFCCVGTYFYLDALADKGKPKNIHIILSVIAFAIWAYSTTGDKLCPGIYNPLIASFAPVVFSLLTVKIPLS